MKILLVDNHDLILDGLARLLTANNISEEVQRAHDGQAALGIGEYFQPDLIISDYRMPGMNGLELLISAKKQGLKSKFMMISMISELAVIEAVLKEGALGFVNKESSTDEMIYGVAEVLAGRKYLCRISQKIIRKNNSQPEKSFLTKRELQILKMILEERKNKEIAEELHIDVSTVVTHKKNMIKKVGVKSSTGLVRYALENKIFD